MLVSDEAIDDIRTTYRRRFNAMIYRVAGAETLSTEEIQELLDAGLIDGVVGDGLIRDAYYVTRVRNAVPFADRPAMSLQAFRDQMDRIGVTLTGRERASLKHIKLQTGNYLTKLKNTALADIEGSIRAWNYDEHTRLVEDVVRPTVAEALTDARSTVQEIASRLRERTGDMYRDWKRVAVTEISNAVNLGAADAIAARNAGTPPSEVLVYKVVVLDPALCRYCRAFYLEADGITPKVYRLSELASNGSNYGKKAADWKPTIGATHPNERCELVELPQGWGFESGSNQATFFGKDFLWIRDRAKMS